MSVANRGRVDIVGAGPGSVAYLTVQAKALIKQADVVVYDALVDEALQTLASAACEWVNVGKRGGGQSTPQAEIDQLLVQYCQAGKRVVRLKSGDPFVFGRTASEIEALKTAGCVFTVVPGISSALAAPLLASIPLTDPVLSRCLAIATAHEPDALNWEALSQLDTLVLLMGGRQLAEIVHQLERHGRSPDTAIAVIRWAGQPEQQIWTGTLASIVQQTARQSLSPCVLVIGEVVRLRPYLQPNADSNLESDAKYDTPLLGKTVLITRSAGQSSQFSTLLKQQGAIVVEMPALVIKPPSSWADLDQAIAQLSTFDWLILTSSNAVDYFFERLAAVGNDGRSLAGVKIAVVGKKTAASLAQRSLIPDFIPPDFVADSLIEHFPDASLDGLKVLFPRVESGGREVLIKEFSARGALVTEVAAYQSGCPDAIAPDALAALQQRQVDVITFASSKTVQHFCQLTAPHTLDLDGVCIASIGPQTSATCWERLGRVDIEAEEYTLEGLTQAIARYYSLSKEP